MSPLSATDIYVSSAPVVSVPVRYGEGAGHKHAQGNLAGRTPAGSGHECRNVTAPLYGPPMANQHTFNVELTNGDEKTVRAAIHHTSGAVLEFYSETQQIGSVTAPAGDLVATFNVKEVRGVIRSDVTGERRGPSVA